MINKVFLKWIFKLLISTFLFEESVIVTGFFNSTLCVPARTGGWK